MLYSTKELGGFTLAARDGDIGHVRELYFDDERWVVRHVVVDTGHWLAGRNVLISPHSIQRLDAAQRRLAVDLSRQQIQDAPGIDTDKPVSRQHEISHYDYYGYPYYWGGSAMWGASEYPLIAGALAMAPLEPHASPEVARQAAEERDTAADPHLHSSTEVIGYDIDASDGGIGHIDDFLFDDQSWAIRYVVVDTRNWWPGQLVLLAPQSIESVDWSRRHARVKVSRDQVKTSPPYDREATLSARDEQRLQQHYGWW